MTTPPQSIDYGREFERAGTSSDCAL